MNTSSFESKIVKVDPGGENNMIAFMRRFGWSLKSSQEIRYDANVEFEKDINNEWVMSSDTTHYVNMHFIRPMNIKNLQQLNDLELEYWTMGSTKEVPSLCTLILGTLERRK